MRWRRRLERADSPGDRLVPPAERRSWRTFERIFALIAAQQLPAALRDAQHRAWIARYPEERQPYHQFFAFLVSHDRMADADALLAAYEKAFPGDGVFPIRARADLALRRGSTADGLAVYEQAFRPLWDAQLVQHYFDLLERTHGLRAFLERARADIAAHPDDITPVARIQNYYQRAGNVTAAEQALADFEARRENQPRTAEELFTLARAVRKDAQLQRGDPVLLRNLQPARRERRRHRERAREHHRDALCRAGAAAAAGQRRSVVLPRHRHARSLPGIPERHPLSAVQFRISGAIASQARKPRPFPYFHRARAAELLTLLDTRFPDSPRRADLNATLIDTYAAYG